MWTAPHQHFVRLFGSLAFTLLLNMVRGCHRLRKHERIIFLTVVQPHKENTKLR